ncbi:MULTISPECIES: putative glycoside hydrolase family 15 protein [unclassified Amycolatopsis]|uniref:putative glycoside hydrolase family 15 protein n=1 Tax=unclassified Amycolatopsis TaxID=2618356 RepID=UPI002875BBBE|nr:MULTISPECIES: putative glycoside hydrolase family 15 protein [unclassified Amycolatopsis]MDS0135318.1 putative glycoside hydrolase family 15 protein [Amycolatopsis sp. 505]MDS0140991.1 putative glycoside hydrolase family 15 protein [Amycolatopsis sp. CM201R]
MPKATLIRRRPAASWTATVVLLASCLAGCVASSAQELAAPPPKPLAPCAWWYGIGQPPTAQEIELAAKRYQVVVLNADQGAAMRRLHQLNPRVKVLVYKDLSSTRNYPGAVDSGQDAVFLPSGIGYVAAQEHHPEWFAQDVNGRRIEWQGYPKHWQMTVWNPDYQKAWTDAVVTEVKREGWDGVLADNDFNSLSHYSSAVLAGTANVTETDRKLRDGLDAFLAKAGDALTNADKLLVPNVSETHLVPGRWTAHSRFGGAMEENFGFRENGGTGGLLTFRGNEFQELRAQAALGESLLLLVTRTHNAREERSGYASAALLAGPRTCWTRATTDDYRDPEWSTLQDSGLGEAVDAASRLPNGVWSRTFTNGWVAVNPTASSQTVVPPEGLVKPGAPPSPTPTSSPTSAPTATSTPAPPPLTLEAADAVVLVDPQQLVKRGAWRVTRDEFRVGRLWAR